MFVCTISHELPVLVSILSHKLSVLELSEFVCTKSHELLVCVCRISHKQSVLVYILAHEMGCVHNISCTLYACVNNIS